MLMNAGPLLLPHLSRCHTHGWSACLNAHACGIRMCVFICTCWVCMVVMYLGEGACETNTRNADVSIIIVPIHHGKY